MGLFLCDSGRLRLIFRVRTQAEHMRRIISPFKKCIVAEGVVPRIQARGRLMPAAALNENSPGDVTQSVAPSQLRHEYALPKTDRWDDETGSERPGASLTA